jgi:CDP-diacylglycerol--glycerol-3-phosphate 3-phosphatidyltransferase
MNLANAITLARLPLLVVIVIIFFVGDAAWRLAAVPLVFLLIVMDAVDGIVARQRDEVTLLGSVLDIAADRAVEIILWVMYANLGLISWIIPVTVIIRGALTDSIREAGYQRGTTAFGAMRTGLGKWIVAGRPMRAAYGMVKALAFVLLAGTLALQSLGSPWAQPLWTLGIVASWIAFVFCIVRGIPVVVEAFAADRGSGARTGRTGDRSEQPATDPHGAEINPPARMETGRPDTGRPDTGRPDTGLVESSRIEKA